MPKRARYPLFFIGLSVILIGSLALNSQGASAATIGAVVLSGFALIVGAVAFR